MNSCLKLRSRERWRLCTIPVLRGVIFSVFPLSFRPFAQVPVARIYIFLFTSRCVSLGFFRFHFYQSIINIYYLENAHFTWFWVSSTQQSFLTVCGWGCCGEGWGGSPAARGTPAPLGRGGLVALLRGRGRTLQHGVAEQAGQRHRQA